MLFRLLEFSLIPRLNRLLHPRSAVPEASSAAPVTADHVVLGTVIPSSTAETDTPCPSAPSSPTPQEVTLSPAARRKHLYLLGATGSGKTNLLLRLIESDLAQRHALCVIDLRGDLVERILPRLAKAVPEDEWAKRLLLLDLRDESSCVGFNPLLGQGDAYTRAGHVLEVLKQQSESWGVQLEETLRFCLLALAESGWSLLEIEPLLENPSFHAGVLAKVSDVRVRRFFTRYEGLSPTQQTTWTLPVLNKLSPLLSIPQLRLLLGQRQTVSFGSLLDTQPGMVILVSLAVDRFHEASRLVGGLLVSSLQNAIMARAEQPEHMRVPAYLYVDEFETMATERFESIIAEGRRFGLGLCLSHQNSSQLPLRLKQVVRNNVHTSLFFQTGAIDAADVAGEIAGGDETREEVRGRLMGQGVGQAYVVRRGQSSVRVQTALCPDPRVDKARVQALRLAAQQGYGRPAGEVRTELEARERELEGGDATTSNGQPLSPASPTTAALTYHIRHTKSHSFKPRPADGDE